MALPITSFNKLFGMTANDLSGVSAAYYANSSGIESLFNVKDLSKGGFTSCYVLPILQSTLEGIQGIYGAAISVIIGGVDLGITRKPFALRNYEFDLGTFDLSATANDFTDYLSHYKLFIPFVGNIEIPANVFVGSSLNLKMNIEFGTGDVLAKVYIITGNTTQLYGEYSGNCAVQIPLVLYSDTTGKDIMNGLMSALQGVATGNYGGTISGITNSIIDYATKPLSSNILSQQTGTPAWLGTLTPYILKETPTVVSADYAAIKGLPLKAYRSLTGLTGFTKISDAHIEGIEATEEELNEIKSLLMEGVIL